MEYYAIQMENGLFRNSMPYETRHRPERANDITIPPTLYTLSSAKGMITSITKRGRKALIVPVTLTYGEPL